MNEVKTLGISKGLAGKPVVVTGATEAPGRVLDVIINPFKGVALGLLVGTLDGAEHFVAMGDCSIQGERVTTSAAAFQELAEFYRAMPFAVCACRELLNAYVVTDQGVLLGRVGEVCLCPSATPQVFYYLVRSPLQRLLGRGFFIAGDAPYAYSRIGARLLVPTGVSTSQAVNKLVGAA
jgi:hypothetical protein